MSYEQIWQAVLGEIEIGLSRANFITWFKNTFIHSLEGNHVVIGVPNTFIKKWLEEKYHRNIVAALENILKEKVEVSYQVELRPAMEKEATQKPTTNETIKIQPNFSPLPNNNPTFNGGKSNSGLNPKYVFEKFIVGKNNELAYAACQAVVNNLGKAYNPLFIYGGVGLGKTHLLQAIGNEVVKFNNQRVLYTTSEQFTNDYIQAVHSGKAKDFKNLYRNVDLLLVDDVQFMGGKDGTQQEFFHTFNELQQADKQIVLSSDRPPKSLPAIEARLISRFESGMVADIGKPDTETKIAILERRAEEKGFPLSPEILTMMAESVQNNIRELEGLLNKIIAVHQLKGVPITEKSVKEIMSDFVATTKTKSLSNKEIIDAVCRYYDINQKDILGSNRKKEFVWPRQIAIYLMREELESSYPTIGQEMGGRDHTTAIHAYNKIRHEVIDLGNEKIKQELNSIKQLFSV
ncbi:MAG: chromosomal replication initiator protein DnaA [Patescibacteria group bacterium]|jgi:chromosomal replication initiator protein